MHGGAGRVALSLIATALLAACAGSSWPMVVEQTQDGVTSLVRNDVQESKDGLVLFDAVERHG